MAASTNSSNPLASVIRHGEALRDLKQRAKYNESSMGERDNIYEKVEKVTVELLEAFNKEPDQLRLFHEESIARFLKKIREILGDFVKLDSDSKQKYENLASKVNDFKLGVKSSGTVSPSLGEGSQGQASYIKYLKKELDLNRLTEKEKKCLFCFIMFPTGVEIKKRELIHWWLGLGSVADEADADEVLNNLMEKGFIWRAAGNKVVYSRYKMNDSVLSKVKQDMSWKVQQVRNFTLMFQDETSACEALLNFGENVLNAKTFDGLSELRNAKVLHLGSWRPDPGNYIVVENTEVLKVLKNLRVRFLSLQGISGIEELPDFVCQLKTLKLLDLRACHNLGSLSTMIGSFTELTHLDLSECYLLENVPAEITSLKNLQVLKGFVINQDPVVGKGKRSRERSTSSCAFNELSKLTNLQKLTVRARRMDFPTAEDLITLCKLERLRSLRVAWTESSTDSPIFGDLASLFPTQLQKLELQAASDGTTSRLLALISARNDISLEKLYIKGGGLSDLSPENHRLHVKELRLRYLSELQIHWDKFRKSFPMLRKLETFCCPNLLFFPCGSNGVWEDTEQEPLIKNNQ